jgi:uroporphyrinogen decarboxylase
MTDPVLIQAYRGNRTATRPVWFMRQAGRSLPEYRAAREGTAMLEACLTPELAAEITVQPVRRHKVDAAIFFSDIMIPAKCAGVGVEIVPGRGPVLDHPIRTPADVDALPELTTEALKPITEGVQATIAMLGDTPLIGFAGAPFTVASYLVEGEPSRSFPHTKALMAEDPATWERLARWVADTTSLFLSAQIDAGAQAIQLFDSWVGALSVEEYVTQAQPYSREVLSTIQTQYDVPRVHFGTGTAHLLPAMYAAGASVMGVDVNLTLDQAEDLLGGNVPLQGNINPAMLSAPWEELERHVRDVLAAGQSDPGHVVNLAHGVPPTTDPDVLTRVVELIHSIPDAQASGSA